MKRQNLRVMLASEHLEVTSMLREVVENDDRAVIVAQAENAVRALSLAKSLRPDIAIIDSSLPYSVGLDNLSMTRIGGLDAAQSISQEIPNMRVILLEDAAIRVQQANRCGASLCRDSSGANSPFTLRELHGDTAGGLVFATVMPREGVSRSRRLKMLSDKAVLLGGIGVVGGLVLVISVLFSGAGAYLTAAGAVTLLAGVVGRMVLRICVRR